jgi:predicted lipoprotein with Yx(FWY)xxD motif
LNRCARLRRVAGTCVAAEQLSPTIEKMETLFHNTSVRPSTPNRLSRTRLLVLAALVATAITASACSSGAGSEPPTKSSSGSAAPASGSTAAAAAPVAAGFATSSLGKILTGADGRTLYAFTNDTNATSTCYSTCAQAWPPVIVGADWTVAPGLDTGIFSTIVRTGGQNQLVVGKWPLYDYAGDSIPGDTAGQGSGGVWYVVGTDGKLITNGAATGSSTGSAYPSAPASGGSQPTAGTVRSTKTNLGTALVDGQGMTLYGFTKDTAGKPTCTGVCATTWPPLLMSGTTLPAGLDPKVFSLVANASGQQQLKAGKWPLYRFSGDAKAGDTNGQGSGGIWFAVAPSGALIK